MESGNLFYTLERVDSTNNYAMQRVHEGMAQHGAAFFSPDQFAGKGQRGKQWAGQKGLNLAMSIVLTPVASISAHPFILSALIACTCRTFIEKHAGTATRIKWPNDLYIGDRKAGGILIENTFQGKNWNKAIVGIGINLNQLEFDSLLPNPISLKQISGKDYEPETLARELHGQVMDAWQHSLIRPVEDILQEYNEHLFAKGRSVKLRRQNAVFETTITGVNLQGQLLTDDSLPRQFHFGEVEWVL